ncbi:GFA family protein [Roseovarius nanhaiticus]|uniref:GFA family protein n=1 Tax=Roseovarius nanhaiticus TaxID=573024 RepID=UPI0024922E5E|nr:GFA family protein [Roseovarius nanhaiticus]
MNRADEIQGQCLCGAVQITVSGAHDTEVGVCHCYRCQRWSGGLYATFDAPAGVVTVRGPVTRYTAPHLAERAFCGICGSNLWLRDQESGADYELVAGIFRAAAAYPVRSEIYIDQAPAYAELQGEHPRRTAGDYEVQHPPVEGETS